MRMYDIIFKKREGLELTAREIDFFVQGYTSGEIPDYQASAFMMAIYFRGMNKKETADLTMSMVKSGDMMDLYSIEGIKVDKHSTGGVGDKTSLVLIPMVAAAGVPVAKMSGRGLGHTGGTIDKLESFPGFSAEVTMEKFLSNVREHGAAIAGQTADLAPADRKLYALRDVTATVDNISLIASSIMSKKIAGGADAMVLDVKAGSGAFMKERESAFDLAREMVDIGTSAGKKTVAFVTDMDQPLGYAVGNILEVQEAIATLRGEGPKDLTELCLTLGSAMLVLAGSAGDETEARVILQQIVASGKALAKLKEVVEAQGGDPAPVDNQSLFPEPKHSAKVISSFKGFVRSIKANLVGEAALHLGAGRDTKNSKIDLSVGIVLRKKVGDEVNAGEPIAIIYGQDLEKVAEAENLIIGAFSFSDTEPAYSPLIKGIVTADSTTDFEKEGEPV